MHNERPDPIFLLKTLHIGDKVRIQNISTMRFRMRWLLRLAILILTAPIISYAKQDELPPKPIFKLVKGQGTEVCEAYLERLNKTEFLDNHPTKGRVIEPLLNGFTDLKPVPLTVEEIKGILLNINSFELYQDQDIVEKYIQQHQGDSLSKSLIMNNEALLDDIKKYVEMDKKTPFVRYQVKLDLDNDGIATNTVIKNNNSIYIVEDSLQRLDEARMMAILGDQDILRWPSVTVFPPLAFPVTVFGFKGKYYFDGFQNFIMTSQRPPMLRQELPMLLKVFSHQGYQTKQVCEYQWLNAVGEGTIYREYTR
jgi:hypothetical protein